jgi:hypothetical protein
LCDGPQSALAEPVKQMQLIVEKDTIRGSIISVIDKAPKHRK